MSDDNSPPDDIFDRYSRDKKPDDKPDAKADEHDAVFSKYDRAPDIVKEEGKPTKVIMHLDTPLSKVQEAASSFNDRMVSGIPILGPLAEKAAAATGAALQPVTDYIRQAQGQEPQFANTSFSDRYANNLQAQNAANQQYGEDHPIAAPVADIMGSSMLLGPVSQTPLGARMMGMAGNSLGSRVYQGAAGMGAMEAGNQLLKGNNPLDQGFVGPVPLATVTGGAGPMVGEGLAAAGNKLIDWLPRRSGPLAGINSTGRNMLTNSVEGETPASIAEAQQRFGPSGMLADVNQQTTDLAGGLADVPGPHKQVVREAYRERAGGQKDRIVQSLEQNTVPQVDIAHLGRLIDQDQKTLSKPLYDQFRSMQVHPTKEIKALIPRLEAAGAFNKAEEIAGISGRPFEKKFFTGGPQKEFPTAEAWDLVKRSLDSRISAALDATKPDKNVASELMKLKEDMLREIDKSNAGPVYKAAREKFAEYATLKEQMKEGGKTWERGNTADELKYEMSLLTPFEMAARRQGARDAVQNIIENSHLGDTTARNKLLTDAGQKKLELLFGAPRAERLIRDLKAELGMSAKNTEVVGGSPTAGKQARRDAIQPPRIEKGYLGNIDITKPSTLVPEWMTPHAIMEGSSAARYANAHKQIAPLLTRKMGDPEFKALVDELLAERAKGDALRNRLNQMGQAATGAIAVSSPALRNRLLHQPATR